MLKDCCDSVRTKKIVDEGIVILESHIAAVKDDTPRQAPSHNTAVAKRPPQRLGDMGKLMQLCKDRGKAKKSFSESIQIWQIILNLRLNSEEYEEG